MEINSVRSKIFGILTGTRLLHHIAELWGKSLGTLIKYLDCIEMIKWLGKKKSKVNHRLNNADIQG